MHAGFTVSGGGGRASAPTQVILHVYDLSPASSWLYNVGFGLHHTGVEIHGREYAFFGGDHAGSGVDSTAPMGGASPPAVWREKIVMGEVRMTMTRIKGVIDQLAQEYTASSYDVVSRNCNCFSNDLCLRLLGTPIPSWINRVASVGGPLVRWWAPQALPSTPGAPTSSVAGSHSFAGDGHVLGTSNPPHQPHIDGDGGGDGALAEPPASMPAVMVDDTRPTTKLQVRPSDGSPVTLLLNQDHRVCDVYAALFHRGYRGVRLFATYPRRALPPDSVATLKEEKLINCVLSMEAGRP